MAAPAAAQTSSGTVTDLLNTLFVSPQPFNPTQSPLLSEADYNRRSQDSIDGVGIGIGNALSSVPLGASSAGFAYRTDPTTGEPVLRSSSFGAVFVDRALTAGKGSLNMGVSFQRGSYDTLQGLNLKDGGFVVLSQLGTYQRDGSGVGDVQTVFLDVSASVFTFAGSVGITDALDFGWAVPVASLSVRGRSVRTYNGGLDWDADLPNVRALYPNKVGEITSIDRTIDKTGIGDIILRTKYAFGGDTGSGVALGAEVRLPTGDEENLLGAGTASFKASLSATKALGSSTALHGYSGYTVGGRTDEINYGVAVDVAVLPSKQMTLSAEFFGRNLRDTVSAYDQLTSFDGVLGGSTPPLARRVIVDYGFWQRGSANLLRGAASARYQLGGTWLLTASVLFRLNDEGYQAKVTPFVGIEHTFGK